MNRHESRTRAQPTWWACGRAKTLKWLRGPGLVVNVVAATQSTSLLRDIVQTGSTNLVNLRQRPLSVMFTSALVISPVAGLLIVVPMVAACGELQR